MIVTAEPNPWEQQQPSEQQDEDVVEEASEESFADFKEEHDGACGAALDARVVQSRVRRAMRWCLSLSGGSACRSRGSFVALRPRV